MTAAMTFLAGWELGPATEETSGALLTQAGGSGQGVNKENNGRERGAVSVQPPGLLLSSWGCSAGSSVWGQSPLEPGEGEGSHTGLNPG